MDFPPFLRCTRTGNCNWRCEAMAAPGRSYCQRHYLEQKRRNQRKRDRRHRPSSSSSSSATTSSSSSPAPSSSTASSSSEDILATSLVPSKRARREAAHVDEEAELYMNQLLPRERQRVKSLRVDFEERSSAEKPGGSPAMAAGSSPGRGACSIVATKQQSERRIRSSGRGTMCFEKEGEPSLELLDSDDTGFDGEMGGSCQQDKVSDDNQFGHGLLLDTFREEKEKGNFMCHQCRDSLASNIVVCSKCHVKHYCYTCLARWYPGQSHDDVRAACPVCSGCCNCKACLRTKFRVHQKKQNKNVKFERLVYLLHQILPILRQILTQQQLELDIEAQARCFQPMEMEIARTKLASDERLYCDNCSDLVVGLYRSCPNCSYDLCLDCCHVLRDGSEVASTCQYFTGRAHRLDEETHHHDSKISSDTAVCHGQNESFMGDSSGKNNHRSKITGTLSCWRTCRDGCIPCPPKERGGCGNRLLVLRSISEVNWLPKLIKKAEALTSDFHFVPDDNLILDCRMCVPSNFTILRRAAFRDNSHDNFLYCPKAFDLSDDDVEHFQSHWRRGEPVIVRGILDETAGLSWEPMVVWRAARETKLKKIKNDGKLVKAIRCLDWREVEMNIHQFFRGYLEGQIHETGWPELFMLKDWPPSSLEECLPKHCMEFIDALPFYDYTNPKYGTCNLVNKFPHGHQKPRLGPKISIAYGFPAELGRGDSVIKLHCNMSDVVNVLTHTHEVKMAQWQRDIISDMRKKYKDEDLDELYGLPEDPELDRRQLKVSPPCETVKFSFDLASPKEFTRMVEKSVSKLSDRQMQDTVKPGKVCSDILDSHLFPQATSIMELDAASANYDAVEKSCSSKDNLKKISTNKFYTEDELRKIVLHNRNFEGEKRTADNDFHIIREGKDAHKNIENDIRALEKEKRDRKVGTVGCDPGDVSPEEKCVFSLQKLRKEDASHTEDISMVGSGGAVWDVFRRQDVPKLSEYLQSHQKEFRHINNLPICSVIHPIHDKLFFLNERHKRQLKEEYGIEPWTFEQHLGDSVFIPAGCPYQVRNRQPCVKVALDFVSPESTRECVKLAEEFRCLPKVHHSREDKLEVKEMALHAASASIREALDILGKFK